MLPAQRSQVTRTHTPVSGQPPFSTQLAFLLLRSIDLKATLLQGPAEDGQGLPDLPCPLSHLFPFSEIPTVSPGRALSLWAEVSSGLFLPPVPIPAESLSHHPTHRPVSLRCFWGGRVSIQRACAHMPRLGAEHRSAPGKHGLRACPPIQGF